MTPAPARLDPEQESLATMRESLATLVRLIERVAPGMRGSVLLLDGESATLRHGAAPSLPAGYCKAIDGSKIGPSAGSCGTAAFRGERVIVRDISTDPLWSDYKQLAAPHRLAACWSTPIIDTDGTVLGTFAMYYDEPREPTAGDLALTETATTLARNVIKRWRGAAALRARTEAAERLATELAESEVRFRAMAATIPVQVWTAQADGMLDYVSEQTAGYFGVSPAELLGEGWASVVHPDDLANAGTRWKHSIECGEPYEVQFRVRSRDGEYRWQLVRAQAVRSDGRIVQWVGANSDIEDYKRLEAALDTALTAAIQANKAKADFLAVMSHELRTPLNAIGGYAQLMIDGIPGPVSDSHKDYLRRIVKSQGHLLGLIETVLTQSKLEAGKVSYRMADTRIGEVLEDIESLTAPQRAANRLTYSCDRCDPGIVVSADREKLVQVLLNVLSNAAKFTPAEGTITVRTATTQDRAEISVTDTGVGMSAEQLAVVFEPYVQFDSSLSREHKGTGLGMAISRELARGMGGDLTATSEPGVGSTFTVSLERA